MILTLFGGYSTQFQYCLSNKLNLRFFSYPTEKSQIHTYYIVLLSQKKKMFSLQMRLLFCFIRWALLYQRPFCSFTWKGYLNILWKHLRSHFFQKTGLYCKLGYGISTPIPRIARIFIPGKNRVGGTVLMAQLTRNSPTNAYITKKTA